jgi:hypothetical protein
MLTAFEERLSTVIGIAYVVGFSSGTAALHVALRLCGVGPGDEVWGSTLTFIGGVAPIIYQGAEPVFFDVGPDMLIDLDLLEAELGVAAKKGKLLKVLVTTDLYGHVPDLSRIERLVAEYGSTGSAIPPRRSGRRATADMPVTGRGLRSCRSTATRSLRPPAAALLRATTRTRFVRRNSCRPKRAPDLVSRTKPMGYAAIAGSQRSLSTLGWLGSIASISGSRSKSGTSRAVPYGSRCTNSRFSRMLG